ncbi:MAG TPA: carbohydrate binding domain-containing protein, partial [Candidatus Limnocylindrales bacterium]|nr:carbohydrate binding domain-containing protein [Candidatus Limnocylindrales bacterium]
VPGVASPHAGHITITQPGTNVQMHQKGLVLLPNTKYQLSFKAYSNTGHDLAISLLKDGSPYTKYGLSNYVINLGTAWKDYSIQFTTSGFSGTVTDARLMFWLAPYDASQDQYYFDEVTLTSAPITPPPESVNIVSNPGFESGRSNWIFYTNGAGTFLIDVAGPESPSAGHITISMPGTNVQLRQAGLVLLPNTIYRMSFKAYSITGHDLAISLIKDGSPYTKYGLSNYVINLSTTWKDYSIQFTTSGFSGTVTDARLMFWLAPYDAAQDQYFIDDVTLALVFPPETDRTPPKITLWYGNSQIFGQKGIPQQWVNILGNVQDASGVSSLKYSLNKRNVINLSIGPQYRLESRGDFNVEINHNDLLCADNQLVITAVDARGNSKNEIVSIKYSCNNVWPENYTINWRDAVSIQDKAQIADGLWIKETNSIRPAVIGYDRLITIGDMTWDDYEITVPITINSPLDSSLKIPPNFGFIMRWQGHWDWTNIYPAGWRGIQPRPAWHPLGALGVYIWVPSIKDYRLRIIGNNMKVIADDTTGKHLEVGVPYMFKMRAKTNGTITRYSLKVWKLGTSEPAAWTISGNGVAGELKQGSATLNAHNANVSFGNITIRSLATEAAASPTTQPVNQTVINGSVATSEPIH